MEAVFRGCLLLAGYREFAGCTRKLTFNVRVWTANGSYRLGPGIPLPARSGRS